MAINTLGAEGVMATYPQHTVVLQSKDGRDVELDLVELEEILPQIKTNGWRQGASRFPKSDLPAYMQDSLEIDILVGSDQLHLVMEDEIFKKGTLELRELCLQVSVLAQC